MAVYSGETARFGVNLDSLTPLDGISSRRWEGGGLVLQGPPKGLEPTSAHKPFKTVPWEGARVNAEIPPASAVTLA
jgi:hypothetical protein